MEEAASWKSGEKRVFYKLKVEENRFETQRVWKRKAQGLRSGFSGAAEEPLGVLQQ